MSIEMIPVKKSGSQPAELYEKHLERHALLHRYLDELVADWISNTEKLPSKSTVMELMTWSNKQQQSPDHPALERQ